MGQPVQQRQVGLALTHVKEEILVLTEPPVAQVGAGHTEGATHHLRL